MNLPSEITIKAAKEIVSCISKTNSSLTSYGDGFEAATEAMWKYLGEVVNENEIDGKDILNKLKQIATEKDNLLTFGDGVNYAIREMGKEFSKVVLLT